MMKHILCNGAGDVAAPTIRNSKKLPFCEPEWDDAPTRRPGKTL